MVASNLSSLYPEDCRQNIFTPAGGSTIIRLLFDVIVYSTHKYVEKSVIVQFCLLTRHQTLGHYVTVSIQSGEDISSAVHASPLLCLLLRAVFSFYCDSAKHF